MWRYVFFFKIVLLRKLTTFLMIIWCNVLIFVILKKTIRGA